MLGTVTRAGRLLDLFTAERPEWGPTGAARELDIAKSQAYELLTSLCAIGLLRRSHSGQFRLGWRTLTLGRNVLRTQFPESAIKLLRNLAVAFGEPVQLMALDRNHLEVVASRHGDRGTDKLLPADGWDPYIARCAVGKCLLAGLSEVRVGEVLAAVSSCLPEQGSADQPEALVAELAVIRRERIAIDLGTVDPALRSVAVPVRDATGETLAAVGVWTRATRWSYTGEELTRGVIGVGRRIEAAVRAGARRQTDPAELRPIRWPVAA
jgi:DNA-binding IclR family transcriptional regulator